MGETFDDMCNDLRKAVKVVATKAQELIQAAKADQVAASPANEAKGEMIANATLAYRHLEDASMRIGKAIQAYDGGTSVYDRETTVGA